MSVDCRLTMERKQRLHGPGGLVLELDADQIFPDDPGQGTPCLLVLNEGRRGGKEYSGTFNCAADTGEVDGFRLDGRQMTWLEDIADPVDCWLAAHAKAAREGGVK